MKWEQRFRLDSQAPGFDVKKWARRKAIESVLAGKRAVHCIDTPFISPEVDRIVSDALTNAISEALEAKCERFLTR